MDFEEYDFMRSPVVENETFFLQSKCVSCGFSILARTIEEVLKKEEFHRSECVSSNVA
jgi:hypothetical protein